MLFNNSQELEAKQELCLQMAKRNPIQFQGSTPTYIYISLHSLASFINNKAKKLNVKSAFYAGHHLVV